MSSTESQTHAPIEHYLSQRRWGILGDGQRDLHSKLEEVTDLLHDEIGCSHPREIPTQLRCVALVSAAHSAQFTDAIAYGLVSGLRAQDCI